MRTYSVFSAVLFILVTACAKPSATSYEDCLQRDLAKMQTDAAVRVLTASCRSEFPDGYQRAQLLYELNQAENYYQQRRIQQQIDEIDSRSPLGAGEQVNN